MNFSEFPEKVEIRQKPDRHAEAIGLAKYNRSKMPQCADQLQVAEVNGRFVTGIDEESFDIMRIFNDVERTSKQEEVKKLREYLGRAIGKDLSATSDFWRTFSVTLSSDSPLVLNKHNPLDVIKFYALVSNGYAAPSKKDASHPKYHNTKYYAHFDEIERSEEMSIRRKRDKAKSKLIQYEEDKEMLLLIGQYLEGGKYKKTLKLDTIYDMLWLYVESKDNKNVERFLKAVEKPVSELQFKVNVDKAIKKKLIKFKDGYYQIGSITLGRSADDVYKNLADPEFSMEYHTIKQELEEKE